jgi:hypothetical protein
VALGCGILLSGFAQPLALLIISASVGGTMMCIYSALLISINRRCLPEAIRVRSYRLIIMIISVLVYGALAVLTIRQQLIKL